MLRVDMRTAVDLTRGREYETRAMGFGQRKRAERAHAVDLERV